MPGLYDISSNANVAVGNTVGLYIGSGNVAVVNSAGQLIAILSNSASVGFYLTNANTKVTSTVLTSGVAAGTYGDAYTVPQITVGADGRVTTVANITISGGFGNANVAAYLPTYTGVLNPSTLTAGNIITTAGVYWANGQPYSSGSSGTIYSNVNVAAYIGSNTDPTISSLNANTQQQQTEINNRANIAGQVFTGNVQAPYIIGNGSLLTNLPVQAGTYSNANVAAYLPGYAGPLSSTIISAGNVDATGYFIGDGSKLTNLPVQAGTYSNTNVAAYLTTATIATSGNITGANLTTAGNVTGDYIKGNAALMTALTGVGAGAYGSDTAIPSILVDATGRIVSITTNAISGGGSYGNSNVASYLPTYNGALPNLSSVNTSGNITANAGGYFIGDGSLLTNLPAGSIYSNTNVAAYLTTATISTSGNITGANLTTAGNLTANYVIGNGSLLTDLPVQAGTYSNTNVTAYLTTATISTTGNVTVANLTTAGNVSASYVLGNGSLLTNLPVQTGTYSNTNVTAYLTTATINTTGNITGANLITAGNISGSYILGDGSLLTNLPVQAGTYSNTNVASYLTTATINTTGNITAANLITAGNVYGNYVIGNGSLLTNLPVQTATGTAGGSLTGSYPNPDLATQSGITTGIFGDSVTVPQITIAANGVATSASNVSIVFPVTSGFSGNLVGNTLTASGTGRILANASPQANVQQISTYTQAVAVTTAPSYTGANLNSANQTVVAAFNGNVNFLTSFAGGTRTTIGTFGYLAVTATSANTVMNSADRIRPLVGGMDLNLNGKSWGIMSSASNALLPIVVNGQTLNVYGTGNMGQAAGIAAAVTITPVGGSINAQYVTSNFPIISYSTAGGTYTASNIQYARLYTGSVTATANLTIANVIALHTYSGWTSSNVSLVTNAYVILNEDTRSIIQTAGNIVATTTSNVILGAGQMVSYRDKITALGTTSTIAFDGNVAPSYTATLNGNITLNNSSFTNYASGASVTAIFTQDGTGSRILTSTQIKWAGASSTLSTAAGAIDIANFYYDGTTWYGSLVKGYA